MIFHLRQITSTKRVVALLVCLLGTIEGLGQKHPTPHASTSKQPTNAGPPPVSTSSSQEVSATGEATSGQAAAVLEDPLGRSTPYGCVIGRRCRAKVLPQEMPRQSTSHETK
jgi:hypothetical protein